MIHSQASKYVILVPPQALATNATAQTNTANYADCKGFDQLDVVLSLGVAGATDQLPTALKLQHADDTNASSFGDITGYVGGTSFTIPTAQVTGVTSIQSAFAAFSVPLKGKKRYIRPVLTANTSATNLACMIGILSRAEQAPTTATGVNANVFVTPT